MIDEYVSKNSDRCVMFTSMGQLNYLSALQYTDIVIGNSSSGIIEVPSFHIPTVDIGDRQGGRISSNSVIHCKAETHKIGEAIDKGLSQEFNDEIKNAMNPYEKEHTSDLIIQYVKQYLQQENSVKKDFYDLT